MGRRENYMHFVTVIVLAILHVVLNEHGYQNTHHFGGKKLNL
jgi:hypothetical protein